MAVDFLAKVPSYVESIRNNEIIRRREIVVLYMNDNYKMPRGTPEKTVRALGEMGVKTNKHVVGFDAAVYRNGFLYLTGSAEQKEKLMARAQKRTAELGGVRCLIKDGIASWEQLFPKEAPELVPAPQAETQESEDVVAITIGQLQILETNIGKIREEVARLEAERTMLAEENTQLKNENENLQASIIANEDRLRSLKRMKVEDLADQFPQVAALLDLVTKPTSLPAEAEKGQEVMLGLAKFCEPLGNKPIIYSEKFLRQFSELDDSRLKSTVTKALKFFAKEGPRHSGLEARSLPTETTGIKAGNGYHIRAGRKRRLTYEITANAINFKAILLRGSKDLPYGER